MAATNPRLCLRFTLLTIYEYPIYLDCLLSVFNFNDRDAGAPRLSEEEELELEGYQIATKAAYAWLRGFRSDFITAQRKEMEKVRRRNIIYRVRYR